MFIFILVSLAFFQIGVLISVSNSNLHKEESINNELVLDNDNDNDNDFPNADAATRIPVFYNVFTGSEESIPRVKNIVKEQFSQLRPEQHEVFVRSIGVPFEIENATLVRHDEDGDEAQTLALLWQYCKDHPNPADESAKVVYLHSQRFVQDMVKALQQGTMQDFMQYYRSIDTLLIDDIQFFAKKLRSQEEFFHVFNGLLERGHQMVLTCDRYPREIDGLEERLKSRFVWGLTVQVEPPELETRVAILMKKAEAEQVELDPAVAFFIGERIRSNVRELEGALRRVIANARFTGSRISIEQVKRALRDLLAIQDRQVSLDNIQRTVAEYYNIKISDILSKRRNRTIARPRQMAMYLAKEHTNHSLPEIGDAFGGRDHTTVLHGCRKIAELREGSADVAEDYRNLNRLLSS